MELIPSNRHFTFDGLTVLLNGVEFGRLRYSEGQKAWVLWAGTEQIGRVYYNSLSDTMDAIEEL